MNIRGNTSGTRTMARARKHNPRIPAHIDQRALPKGVYWDASGRGRWFTSVRGPDGRHVRETIAGPTAKLSELHRLMEKQVESGSVRWVLQQFRLSAKWKKLAKATQEDYARCQEIVENAPTQVPGKTFGDLIADRLTQTNVQKMLDRIVNEGHPSKANHVLRYLRRTFKWAGPHVGMKGNPARGIEQADEVKRQRLPTQTAYEALLKFAKEKGALKGRVKGKVPPYLWMVMELAYLCRMRGIEVITMTEARATDEGLLVNRRKGSRDNLVAWNPRLRAAWDAAVAYRREVLSKRKMPEQMRPDDRVVFVAEGGEPLSKSTFNTAWQRLIHAAFENGIVAEADRFSPHDLKRKGVTDTPGTKHEKQDAAGLTEPMMKVYDKSVPLVRPAAD